MQYDATKVLQAQLARSLGLDKYEFLISNDPTTPDFQRTYDAYYVVRRNETWRQSYYELYMVAKEHHYTFEQIIRELYERTKRVEASFSSKMLATIDQSKPVWDRYVLQNLGKELTGNTPDERLNNAIRLYHEIEDWYNGYLADSEATENIKIFDQLLPGYAWITPTKKIDCLLWSAR